MGSGGGVNKSKIQCCGVGGEPMCGVCVCAMETKIQGMQCKKREPTHLCAVCVKSRVQGKGKGGKVGKWSVKIHSKKANSQKCKWANAPICKNAKMGKGVNSKNKNGK